MSVSTHHVACPASAPVYTLHSYGVPGFPALLAEFASTPLHRSCFLFPLTLAKRVHSNCYPLLRCYFAGASCAAGTKVAASLNGKAITRVQITRAPNAGDEDYTLNVGSLALNQAQARDAQVRLEEASAQAAKHKLCRRTAQ